MILSPSKASRQLVMIDRSQLPYALLRGGGSEGVPPAGCIDGRDGSRSSSVDAHVHAQMYWAEDSASGRAAARARLIRSRKSRYERGALP